MLNYIEGSWRESAATERIPVINPATLEEIGRTPLSPASEVDQAAMAAYRFLRCNNGFITPLEPGQGAAVLVAHLEAEFIILEREQ